MVCRAAGLNELFHFDTRSHVSNLLHEMIVLHLGRITYNTAEEFELGPDKELLEVGLLLVPLRGYGAHCWPQKGYCSWNVLKDASMNEKDYGSHYPVYLGSKQGALNVAMLTS